MRIEHPRLAKAHLIFEGLREIKRLTPREPQKFVALFAPTQSGKSIAIKSYIETVIVDEAISKGLFPADMDRQVIAESQRIALHVSLSAKTTEKSLATDILKQFGDPRASMGTAPSLWQRVYDYARYYGTEIIFIDEIQHLDHQVAGDKLPQRAMVLQSTAATDTLKTILIRGLVPLVFVGVTEARNLLFCDTQLTSRCLFEVDFGPLKPDVLADRDIFVEYCGMLGLKLGLHGIFQDETDLLSGDIPANIQEVAGGRLGMASNLVLQGSFIGNERGARCLSREDLSDAVDTWAIPLGTIRSHHFLEGH